MVSCYLPIWRHTSWLSKTIKEAKKNMPVIRCHGSSEYPLEDTIKALERSNSN